MPSGKPANGFVQIKLLNKEEWKERTLKETMATIMQLTEQGVKPSQIAILVRTNRTIKDLAEFLMNNGCPYPLVSDEAFRLMHPVRSMRLLRRYVCLFIPMILFPGYPSEVRTHLPW